MDQEHSVIYCVLIEQLNGQMPYQDCSESTFPECNYFQLYGPILIVTLLYTVGK